MNALKVASDNFLLSFPHERRTEGMKELVKCQLQIKGNMNFNH